VDDAPAEFAAMMTIIGLLVLLPFAVLADLFRLARVIGGLRGMRGAVQLPQRNKRRATAGAFVLVACAVLAVHGFPVIGWQVTAGLGAFALLYLVVGIHGSQGAVIGRGCR
jgi:hypothetical protein